MSTLKQFVLWVDVPIEQVTHKTVLSFIDYLLDKRLKPKTINCYLNSIRGFYEYLIEEEQVPISSPGKARLFSEAFQAIASLSER